MELVTIYPGHPNPQAGLTRVLAEYYFMHSAFSWLEEIFEFIKSLFQTFIGFFSSKEITNF